MKIATKIIILMLAVLVIYGCQESNSGTNFNNSADNSPILPGGDGDNNTDGGDNGGNTGGEDNETDPDNPENPSTELPPIADNTDDGIVETVTIDSGKDKTSGNGSYISSGKTGLYDINLGSDIAKPISVNTTGKIQANISFMQSHHVAHNGNSINSKPELVAHKDALILVSTTTFYKSMEAVIVTGNKTAVIKLDPPHQLPEVDSTRPDKKAVAYTNRAWSGIVPAKYMKAGMKVTINAVNANDVTVTDTFKNEKIDFESPIEATVYLTRIGLLEAISPYTSTDNYLVNNPARAMAEYLQTVPLAKIVYSRYNDVTINKALDSNGNTVTAINANLYNDIVVNQIGAGIQFANKGVSHSNITASAYKDRDPMYVVLNQTATSRPSTTDNKGVISIFNTSGNQFSRYMGYTYGLTDNVDLDKGILDGSVHNYNTGWGYDSYKNRMRGNLAWNDNGSTTVFEGINVAGFQNIYGWQKDPMSMGEAFDNSTISQYPYHTARSADYIQGNIGNKYMLDDTKANGKHHYIYWDKKDDVYKYVTDEAFLAERITPTEKGVPVYTIIGMYNVKSANQSIIYPAFKAGYGNVFGDLFLTAKPSGYMLEITYKGGAKKYVNLAVSDSSSLRRFHINIPQSENPESVILFVNGMNKGSITIDANTTSQEPVIIGKGKGYEDVIESDINELVTTLGTQSVDNYLVTDRMAEIISNLDFNNRIDSITDVNTRNIVDNYNAEKQVVANVQSVIYANQTKIENGNTAAIDTLRTALDGYNFIPEKYVGYKFSTVNRCFVVQTIGGKLKPQHVNCYDDNESQKWFMDKYQRVRPLSHPHLCFNNSMDANGLVYCNSLNSHKWKEHATLLPDDNGTVYQNVGNSQCIDYGAQKLYSSACHGKYNQHFIATFNGTTEQRYKTSIMKFSSNKCVYVDNNRNVLMSDCPSDINDNESYKWFIDSNNRVHSGKFTSYCLEMISDSKTLLVSCSDRVSQQWIKDSSSNMYKNSVKTGKCFAYLSGNNTFGTANCSSTNTNVTFTNAITLEENKAVSTFSGSILDNLDKWLLN